MNAQLPNPMSQKLVKLYQTKPAATALFDLFKKRRNEAKETKVRVASDNTGFDYKDIVELFKSLDEIGAGNFIVGRKGAESRIQWQYDIRSLALIASGEGEVPEPVASNAPDDDEYIFADDCKVELLTHEYSLRSDLRISVKLPTDLSALEAKRLSIWLTSLPFEADV